jgi:hypothetical protein
MLTPVEKKYYLVAIFGDMGVTGRELSEILREEGVTPWLKDEGCSDNPRIERFKADGIRGFRYRLTKAGWDDLRSGIRCQQAMA